MGKNKDIFLTCCKCRNEYLFQWTDKGKLPSSYPFCSIRCKNIDLLSWLTEKVSIEEPLSVAQQLALDLESE